MWVCLFTQNIYGVARADVGAAPLSVKTRHTFAYLSRPGETHDAFDQRMYVIGQAARLEAKRVGQTTGKVSDAWEWQIAEVVPEHSNSGENATSEQAIPGEPRSYEKRETCTA